MTNTPFTAVIVEPRKHVCLEYVLNNFNQGLDNQWQFLIIHGNENKEMVEEIVKTLSPRKILLKNLGVEKYSTKEYNLLFYDKNFYDLIPSEIFLIFQTDALICLKNKHLINNFLQYDYVGAPWNNKHVGNGGLSLRRKSKMLEILEKCDDLKLLPNGEYFNEDSFFSEVSENIANLHVYKPSFEEAQNFSVETVFNHTAFGTHNGWKFRRSREELIQFLNCFPEVIPMLKILNNQN